MSNQDIFIEANKALAEGKYDEFITYCTEDIKWECVGETTFNGKVELLRYISSTYDGLIFTTEKYIQDKDFVVELGQIIFEKNGETKKSSYCDVWNFRDGMVRQVTSFVICKSLIFKCNNQQIRKFAKLNMVEILDVSTTSHYLQIPVVVVLCCKIHLLFLHQKPVAEKYLQYLCLAR